MLFEDNDEIDYNPSNDEIKRVNLNKTKSERVYEDIIKE